jgi:hypothetical protein
MKNKALVPTILTPLLLVLFVAAPAQACQWDAGRLEFDGFFNIAVPPPSHNDGKSHSEGQALFSRNGFTQPWSVQRGNDHPSMPGESADFHRLAPRWLDPCDHTSCHYFNYERDGSLISLYFDSQLIFSFEPPFFMPGGSTGGVDQLNNRCEAVCTCKAVPTCKVVPLPGALFLFGSGLAGLVALRKKFKG